MIQQITNKAQIYFKNSSTKYPDSQIQEARNRVKVEYDFDGKKVYECRFDEKGRKIFEYRQPDFKNKEFVWWHSGCSSAKSAELVCEKHGLFRPCGNVGRQKNGRC